MQSQNIVNGNFVLGKAGLTGLSGAATTFTAVAFLYAQGGKAFNKGASAAVATPTVDGMGKAITVQPGTGIAVLWCVDAAGAIKLCAGAPEQLDPANPANFQFAPPQFALVGDDLTPFAYSIHKVAPGAAAFTLGVSQWAQAGSTHTAQDIITIPGRPQTA